LKKWAFLATVVSAVVIGCGGAGGGSDTTGGSDGGSDGGGTTSGTSSPVILLGREDNNNQAKPGQIELAILTGQGRSTFAPGDTFATVTPPTFTDTRGEIVIPPSDEAKRVKLNDYSNNISRINANVASIIEPETGRPLNSRLFQTYSLLVSDVTKETGTGVLTATSLPGLPDSYSAGIRIFPGRYTTQPVFLDDAMVDVVAGSSGDSLAWADDQFRAVNGLDFRPRLPSFISDYVGFDISAMPAADRPQLSTGAPAGRVYFSGDNYSISEGGLRGLFEAINRTNFDPGNPAASLIEGRFAPPGELVSGAPSNVPGTYSLLQPSPADPFFIARITSLQGIWRDHGKMIRNMPDNLAIAFPSSSDNEEQDVLFVRQNVVRDGNGNTVSASISSLYYGVVNYATKTIRAYPIKNITTAAIDGERTGTVGTMFDKNGVPTLSASAARTASFSGLNVPGFPSSGTIVIYRF